MMTASDAADLYRAFNDAGIRIWIDGGWAVDALLGRQTRPHSDLDIAVEQSNLARLRELLAARGYKDVPRDDTSAWNFVLGDDQGREVDVHAIVFDRDGNGLYGPAEKGAMYPAAALTGTGAINGQVVECISAEPWCNSRPATNCQTRIFGTSPLCANSSTSRFPRSTAASSRFPQSRWRNLSPRRR